MIQFNLLPDIKQTYIKSQRLKRLIIFIATAVTAASVALFIFLLLFVDGVQKKSINDLTKDISSKASTLKKTPELDKILTVQNQLKSLPDLHAKKPVVSRLFTFIPQLTPAQISISKLTADFSVNTLVIDGTTDTLDTVNTYIDTLKFTTFSITTSQKVGSQIPAFKEVVLSSFSRDAKSATYTINLSFDPSLFSEAAPVTLTVPNKITTRSEVAQPTDLFQKPIPGSQ